MAKYVLGTYFLGIQFNVRSTYLWLLILHHTLMDDYNPKVKVIDLVYLLILAVQSTFQNFEINFIALK